jgi:hypothetical protein
LAHPPKIWSDSKGKAEASHQLGTDSPCVLTSKKMERKKMGKKIKSHCPGTCAAHRQSLY